jgi:hypothetical protein
VAAGQRAQRRRDETAKLLLSGMLHHFQRALTSPRPWLDVPRPAHPPLAACVNAHGTRTCPTPTKCLCRPHSARPICVPNSRLYLTTGLRRSPLRLRRCHIAHRQRSGYRPVLSDSDPIAHFVDAPHLQDGFPLCTHACLFWSMPPAPSQHARSRNAARDSRSHLRPIDSESTSRSCITWVLQGRVLASERPLLAAPHPRCSSSWEKSDRALLHSSQAIGWVYMLH